MTFIQLNPLIRTLISNSVPVADDQKLTLVKFIQVQKTNVTKKIWCSICAVFKKKNISLFDCKITLHLKQTEKKDDPTLLL